MTPTFGQTRTVQQVTIRGQEGQRAPVPEPLKAMLERVQAREASISKFQYACAVLLPDQCQILPRW